MNKIPISELTANTYFSSPVWLDEKFILLAQSVPVTPALIGRLRQWGFPHVLSQGTPDHSAPIRSSINTDAEAMTLHHDLKEQENIRQAAEYFQELLSFTERTFTNFVTKSSLSIQSVGDAAKELIDKTRSLRNYILRLTDIKSDEKNYIIVQSVKTAILSVAMGIMLKIPVHKLIELGMAALLHEIGLIRLPPHLYMSSRVLSKEEKRTISAHSVLGFKILKSFSFTIPVCTAVLNHREHLDGSGYPRGLKGESISQFAMIIGIASSYSALTSQRPFRPAMDPHMAIRSLLKERGTRYDETVLKSLVYCLSIYPLGSHVLLANSAMGMVVETSPENPKTPTVKILVQGGSRLKDPVLIKSDETENRILRPLTPQEIRQLHPDTASD